MEKKDAKKEPFNRPDGVEVKLTAKSINIKGFLFFFILFLTGSYLFVYVWDEPSSYSAGRLLGTAVKGISRLQVMLCIVLLLVFYILIQAGILYWFSGKDKKLLHWHFDWTGVGFSLTRPIPLKFYRVSLLLPGILLGVMPAIHGFCTGEANIFFLGLFGILGGTGDFLFWYSLRAFDDEDLLLSSKKAFQATIIKRNYGKKCEFSQAGIELMGSDSTEADAETIAIAVKSVLACGISEFKLNIGQVEFFNAVLDEAGFNEDEREKIKDLIANRDYAGVEYFVEDKNIPSNIKKLFLELPRLVGGNDILEYTKTLTKSRDAQKALAEMEELYNMLILHGVNKYVSFDMGMVNQLNYYTGIIFRGYTYGTGYSIVDG